MNTNIPHKYSHYVFLNLLHIYKLFIVIPNSISATLLLSYGPLSRLAMAPVTLFNNLGKTNHISNPRYAMPNLSMPFGGWKNKTETQKLNEFNSVMYNMIFQSLLPNHPNNFRVLNVKLLTNHNM